MKKILSYANENRLYVLLSSALILSFEASFFFYYGNGITSIWMLLGGALAAVVLGVPLSLFIEKTCLEYRINETRYKTKVIMYFVALMVMQLPVFLAFYPGIIFYDIGVQIEQYESGMYAANHPLLHTLFMGFFKNLYEEPNKGYAFATLLQLGIVDICLAYMADFARTRLGEAITWVMVVWIGVNPVYSLLAISSTKDIIFAALLCVVYVDVYKIAEKKQTELAFVRMTITGVMMILMRANAIYAIVPAGLVWLFMFRHDRYKLVGFLKYVVCVVCISVLINHLLIWGLNAYKGSIKEMLSIPVQIDARIYNTVANEEERGIIRKYIAEPERYRYYISDPVKEQLDFDTVDSQCKHFLLDSTVLALKHPIEAINAVMYNTQGYWDIFHSAYQEEHQYVARSEDYRGGATIDSKIPGLLVFYMKHYRLLDFEKWNVLGCFEQLGIYVWMSLWALIRAIKQKKISLVASSVLVCVYLLTLMLGPAAIMRYGLPFMFLGPIGLLLSFQNSKI